jgi:hypothetical protein
MILDISFLFLPEDGARLMNRPDVSVYFGKIDAKRNPGSPR